jgi:hypothetical protein
MYDVPRLGEAFTPRGLRGATVVLDEFTPTHLDAWLGRVLLADGTAARALVVRHAGDVLGRKPLLRRSGAVLDTSPPPRPLAGIVVEANGTTLVWLPDRDPALLATELSRAEWRSFL